MTATWLFVSCCRAISAWSDENSAPSFQRLQQLEILLLLVLSHGPNICKSHQRTNNWMIIDAQKKENSLAIRVAATVSQTPLSTVVIIVIYVVWWHLQFSNP